MEFFMAYVPRICAQTLALPIEFCLRLQGVLPETVFLRDRNANLWPIKTIKIENIWILRDGWEKFVQDNSIEIGDTFLFKYQGDNLFDVKFFCLSGSENEGHVVDNRNNFNDQDDASEDNDIETEKDHSVDYNDIDDEKDDYYHRNEEEEQENDGRQRKRMVDPFGEDIFRSGRAMRPQNSYFVVKMSTKRRSTLMIPDKVIDAFILKLPDTTVIVDEHRRQWIIKLHKWKDGRYSYTKGWNRLCRANSIGEQDYCICEFVEEGQGESHIMCIHVRVVKA